MLLSVPQQRRPYYELFGKRSRDRRATEIVENVVRIVRDCGGEKRQGLGELLVTVA